jgi:hypothetical protein
LRISGRSELFESSEVVILHVILAESESTQSIPDIGSQVQKGNGNYGRDPVKGFIIVPCSSAAGVSIENIWNEWSDDQEDMGLDPQDIRKNITLQD